MHSHNRPRVNPCFYVEHDVSSRIGIVISQCNLSIDLKWLSLLAFSLAFGGELRIEISLEIAQRHLSSSDSRF